MKKIALIVLAAVATMAFAACNCNKSAEGVADSAACAVKACDKHQCDSTCCQCSDECREAKCAGCEKCGTAECCGENAGKCCKGEMADSAACCKMKADSTRCCKGEKADSSACCKKQAE
ncbi:MAG: hypothetical protein IJU19_07065 [Bacteroidales bacterium]|nr:hypothetical protein [Bacteroidales bacterium]